MPKGGTYSSITYKMDFNPYDLLDAEGATDADPQALKNLSKPADKKEPKAAAKAPAAKTSAAPAARGGRGGDRGGRGPSRGRGFGGAPRAEGGDVAENGYDEARGRGTREGGRGRGGRGRGRGGYDSNRPPRREFDRHDGTGRGYETSKRSGGGRGNWGAEDGSAELRDETIEPRAEEAAEKPAAAEGEEAPAEETEQQEPAVEEPKEMTLEEYEAILAEKKAELNKARQARSIDTSEFANLKMINKDEEEQENPLEVSTSKEKKGPRAKERKEVQTVEVGFKVVDNNAGERRGRGDRGGRGGRGRGFGGPRGGGGGDRPYSGGRGGRGGSAAINVEDTSAFPSLG